MVELLLGDVAQDVVAHRLEKGLEERCRNGRLSGEAGQGENVALVAILEVLDGGGPHGPGRQQAGDQDHRPAVAGAGDLERVDGLLRLERQRGGQQTGDDSDNEAGGENSPVHGSSSPFSSQVAAAGRR